MRKKCYNKDSERAGIIRNSWTEREERVMLYELKRLDAYSINDEELFTLAHDYEEAINKFAKWLVKDTAWDTTVVNYDIINDVLVRETEIEGLDDLIVTRYKVILRSSIDLLDSDLNDLKENILKGKIGIESDGCWLVL